MVNPTIATSQAFVPPERRDAPSVVTTHMFQDSFSALPGRMNGVGGSATVHALQAQELGSQGVMVAPSRSLGEDISGLPLPAVAYSFVDRAEDDHDLWYDEKNLNFLVEQVMGRHTGRNDVVYAHMPISGHVGMDYCRSHNNPLVYLGHAWEILSAAFFPERQIKPSRIATEYMLIDYLASKPGRGFIITNSKWEADAVAEIYSQMPTSSNVAAFMREKANRLTMPDGTEVALSKVLRDLNQGRTKLVSREEIKALCLPNPIGIDGTYYSDAYRAEHRTTLRAQFLRDNDMPENAVVIGGVGRIHPQKDPFTAVEVFHKAWDLLGRPDNVFLYLAGPGRNSAGQPLPYFAQLLEFIRTHHSEVARFIRVPGTAADARNTNALLDIRLCTATFETWGLSFQESLCMGVPSVARANPVYSELYGASGVILENTVPKLAEALVELVRSPWQREQYGKLCRVVGTRYDWKNSVDLLRAKLRDRLNFPT